MTQSEPKLSDLIDEATEEIRSDPVFTEETSTDEEASARSVVERKRKELLLLSSDGEITKSVSFINKASAKTIEKLYAEYEAKRLDESAVFLCDLFISKFATLMGGLDAIEKPDELEKELKNNPLLKKDLKVVMTWLTPFIPFLGVLSGGVTVGKHVWNKSNKTRTEQSASDHDECTEQDE